MQWVAFWVLVWLCGVFASELECLSINLSGFIFFIYLVFQQQYFYEDDDRIVPSTPTLPPPRSDGFAEAIQYVFLPLHFVVVVFLLLSQMTDSFSVVWSSPQIAGVSRFRFGPSDDFPQTSSSHSDFGQLPSQGSTHYLTFFFRLMTVDLTALSVRCWLVG